MLSPIFAFTIRPTFLLLPPPLLCFIAPCPPSRIFYSRRPLSQFRQPSLALLSPSTALLPSTLPSSTTTPLCQTFSIKYLSCAFPPALLSLAPRIPISAPFTSPIQTSLTLVYKPGPLSLVSISQTLLAGRSFGGLIEPLTRPASSGKYYIVPMLPIGGGTRPFLQPTRLSNVSCAFPLLWKPSSTYFGFVHLRNGYDTGSPTSYSFALPLGGLLDLVRPYWGKLSPRNYVVYNIGGICYVVLLFGVYGCTATE
jgi:hypothetical protein